MTRYFFLNEWMMRAKKKKKIQAHIDFWVACQVRRSGLQGSTTLSLSLFFLTNTLFLIYFFFKF